MHMCKMHENLGFYVHHLKIINTINLDDLGKAITRDTENISACSENVLSARSFLAQCLASTMQRFKLLTSSGH